MQVDIRRLAIPDRDTSSGSAPSGDVDHRRGHDGRESWADGSSKEPALERFDDASDWDERPARDERVGRPDRIDRGRPNAVDNASYPKSLPDVHDREERGKSPVDRTPAIPRPAGPIDFRDRESPPAPRDERSEALPPVRRSAALLLVIAAVVAGIGALLPWSEMASEGETRTFSGLVVGDGRVILALAVGLGLIGLGRLVRRPVLAADVTAARILAVAILVFAGADRAYGPATLASFRAISADLIVIRPRIGLSVCIVAGVLALVAAVLLRPRRPDPR